MTCSPLISCFDVLLSVAMATVTMFVVVYNNSVAFFLYMLFQRVYLHILNSLMDFLLDKQTNSLCVHI